MGNPSSKARDGDYRMKYRSWRLGNKEGTRESHQQTRVISAGETRPALTPPVTFSAKAVSMKEKKLHTSRAMSQSLQRPNSFAMPSPTTIDQKNDLNLEGLAAPVDPPTAVARTVYSVPEEAKKRSSPKAIPQDALKQSTQAFEAILLDSAKKGKSPEPPKSIEEKVMAKIPKALSTGNLAHQATFPKFQAQPVRSTTNLQEALIEQLCDNVAVAMVGAQYANSASGQILNHLYKPVYDSVRKHIKRMPRKYALTASPVEVAADLPLLAEVTRNPGTVAVNVTSPSGDVSLDSVVGDSEFVVLIAAKDRKSLLDAITRSLSARANIISADIVTTNDGFVLDRFTCVQDSSEMSLNPLDLKNEIEFYLNETVSNSPNPVMYAAKMRELEGSQVEVAAKAVLPAVALPALPKMPEPVKAEPISTSSDTSWEITFNEIENIKVIGLGRTGKMYHAKYNGKDVAAKTLDLSRSNVPDKDMLMGEFYREVTIVSKLSHPNICAFIGVAISEPKFVTVFELLRGGSLSQLIRRQSRYSFFKLAREISAGMCYLHQNHVIHRDLKSDNILLDDKGTVKIIDFGLSCFAGTGSEMTAETGTYRWMSPEVIRHEPYSFSTDVYSFGIVLWELLARQQPYAGMTPVQAAFAVAKQNMRPRLPSYVPPEVAALIKQCWNQNPRVRPTFQKISEALEHILENLSTSDREMLDFSENDTQK